MTKPEPFPPKTDSKTRHANGPAHDLTCFNFHCIPATSGWGQEVGLKKTLNKKNKGLWAKKLNLLE